LLGDNGKVVYYVGLLATPLAGPKDITFGKDGIRKELSRQQKVLAFCSKGSLKRINCNYQTKRNQIIKFN
jgi:hypothetical protein